MTSHFMMSQNLNHWYIEIYSWKFHETLLKVVSFNIIYPDEVRNFHYLRIGLKKKSIIFFKHCFSVSIIVANAQIKKILQDWFLQMPRFKIFCWINFCECLSFKYFVVLIFAKKAEIRKNKYRKNLYRKILSRKN